MTNETTNTTNTAKTEDTLTMADHAEAWIKEQGKPIPVRFTPEWKKLYYLWIDYAFDYNKQRNRYLGFE